MLLIITGVRKEPGIIYRIITCSATVGFGTRSPDLENPGDEFANCSRTSFIIPRRIG